MRLLVRDEGECEPGLLAAGHRCDGREGRVAAEVEAAEEITEFLLAPLRIEPRHVGERRIFRAELFELVLREVADAHVAPEPADARDGFRRTGDQADQRRFAGAVAAEQTDACTGAQRELDVVQDAGFAVAGGAFLEDEERVGRTAGVRELEGQRRFDVDLRDELHAFERLQAALGLARLRRLRAEAVHEALEPRDLGLLAAEHRLVLREHLGARTLEVGVVAGVELQARLIEMADGLDDRVEEFPVVRDHEQRAAVGPQPRFEPQHGVEVQVVRRLVEEQQVGPAHQRPRELQPHAPSAGELADLATMIGIGESETGHQRCGAGLGGMTADVDVAGVEFGSLESVVADDGEVVLDGPQFDVTVDHELDGFALEHRDFLGDVRDDPGRGDRAVAGIGLELTAQQREEAGLAAAVGADDADALARMHGEVGPFEQALGTAQQGQLGDADHRDIGPGGAIGSRGDAPGGRECRREVSLRVAANRCRGKSWGG